MTTLKRATSDALVEAPRSNVTACQQGSPARTVVEFLSVCIVAMLIALIFWNLLPASWRTNEAVDYTNKYAPAARNLLDGKGFARGDGAPETRITPGFPLLLVMVFSVARLLNASEEFTVGVFNLFCAGLAAGLVYLIARTVWRSWVVFIPPALWVTYPLALWLTKQPNSEMPFQPAFLASVYVLLRIVLGAEPRVSQSLLAGFLAGVAMLIRPIAIGLPIVEATLVFLLTRGRPFGRTVALSLSLIIGSLVAVLPWELWLYSVNQKVTILSTGGASGMRDGLSFAAGGYAEHAESVPADVRGLMQKIVLAYEREPSVASLVTELYNEALERPMPVIKLAALKASRSWFGTDSQRLDRLIGFVQALYLLPILASAVICWRVGGTRKALAIAACTITVYFWMMTVLVMSIVRYMVPPTALLFLLVPALLQGADDQSGSGRTAHAVRRRPG